MIKTTMVLLLSVALFSCSKTNDEMVVGSWTIGKYLRNGVDETSKMKITNYVETYSESGTYSRTYVDGDGKSQADASGKWTYTEDATEFKITSVSSLKEFSDENSTLSTDYYTIVQLEGSDYTYSFTNGGDSHQFEMTKQ